jgi:hypothetical protein
MQKKRPTAVLVIAILQLVFGGLSLLQALQHLTADPQAEMQQQLRMQQAMQQNQGNAGKKPPFTPEDVQEYVADKIPRLLAYGWPLGIANAVLCVLMIVSGTGLLLMRNWARHLSILYAVGAVAYRVAYLCFLFMVIVPLIQGFFQFVLDKGLPPKEAQAVHVMSNVFSTMFVMVGVLLGLIGVYPVVVVCVVLSKSVTEAFRAGPGEPGEGQTTAGPADAREPFRPAGPGYP